MKATRRQALLLVGTAAVPVTTEAQQQGAPKSADEELEAARRSATRMQEQLAKVKLDSQTEPAFIFRAS